MSVCEAVLARKRQQQREHLRNAGRAASSWSCAENHEYAIKKIRFFCVKELTVKRSQEISLTETMHQLEWKCE